jgi:hypothetical protein
VSPVRRIAISCAAALALAAAASAGAAPDPPVRISGSDRDVWNVARPTPSYLITAPARGAKVTWRLTGAASKQGSGRSPLRLSFPGLKTGTYRLTAEAPDARAARRNFSVDVTPPTIAIRSPSAGAVYLPGQAVAADYSCAGATACTGSVASGALIDTSLPGEGSLAVSAIDAAGNTAARSVSYRIGPAAPTIVERPASPTRDPRPAFAWSGGEPGALFTWQVLAGGAVISQGDTLASRVEVGPLAPGSYAFQVRQATAPGRSGPPSIPDPFTVVAAGAGGGAAAARPQTLNAGRLRPAAGARTTAPRPVLAWRPVRGAAFYNLQVYRVRGTRMTKVASLFPRRARASVGGLRFGHRYAWRVWVHLGGAGYASQPLGVSFFDLDRPVRLTPGQMLTDRRIAQAALRRVTAIERWLDAGIVAGDIRHQGLGAAAFDAGLGPAGPPSATGTAAAAVRSIPLGAAAAGTPARRVAVSARELLATQRIAQAAIRRVDALEVRLKAGLTGGDVVDGSVGAEKLAPGVALADPAAAAPPQPPSAIPPAPRTGRPRTVRLDPRVLLVTQRISQSAVRRADAIRARLADGLDSSDFRPGSLTAVDLSPALRGSAGR